MPQRDAESPIDAEVSANLVALHKARICGKKAVALARLEWVTPEYVRAMHARWEQEGHNSRETEFNHVSTGTMRYVDSLPTSLGVRWLHCARQERISIVTAHYRLLARRQNLDRPQFSMIV